MSSAGPSKPSKSSLFLNRISHEFLETLYTQTVSINLVPHVNPQNLVYITANHLKTLKSPNEENGTYSHRSENYNKFFFIIGTFIFNWLSCQMDPHNITNPSQRYHQRNFSDSDETNRTNEIKYKNFHTEKRKILRDMNISPICLRKYHVVLRRKKLSMRVLVVSETATTGKFFKFLVTSSNIIFLLESHLCDTTGCLRSKHIIDESKNVNLNRQKCAGMVISIRDDSITGMAPRRHGVDGCGLNGDPFEFSCRKVRVIFHCPRVCGYIDSLRS